MPFYSLEFTFIAKHTRYSGIWWSTAFVVQLWTMRRKKQTNSALYWKYEMPTPSIRECCFQCCNFIHSLHSYDKLMQNIMFRSKSYSLDRWFLMKYSWSLSLKDFSFVKNSTRTLKNTKSHHQNITNSGLTGTHVTVSCKAALWNVQTMLLGKNDCRFYSEEWGNFLWNSSENKCKKITSDFDVYVSSLTTDHGSQRDLITWASAWSGIKLKLGSHFVPDLPSYLKN